MMSEIGLWLPLTPDLPPNLILPVGLLCKNGWVSNGAVSPTLIDAVLAWTQKTLAADWRLTAHRRHHRIFGCYGWVTMRFATEADCLVFRLRWL